MYHKRLTTTLSHYEMNPISTRIVVPQAPWSFSTFAYKFTWSWFGDHYSFLNRVDWVIDLIEEERLKLPSQSTKDIFLVGISQGALLSFGTLLQYQPTKNSTHFGGIVGVIGAVSLKDSEINRSKQALQFQQNTPLLLFNGELDEIFPPDEVTKSYEYFLNKVYVGKYKENLTVHMEPDMAHEFDDNVYVMI